jgi:hypothetical protein
VTKAGHAVPKQAAVRINAEEPKYVCRAGFKLEKALDHFGLDVTGMAALDAGLSTGGFTHCLLKRGARHVSDRHRQQQGVDCAAERAAVSSNGASLVCGSGSQGVCVHAGAHSTGWVAVTVSDCAVLLPLLPCCCRPGRCMCTGLRCGCWAWPSDGQHCTGPSGDCDGAHQSASPTARAAA